MTTTVLVPLDGSDKDERALPAAAALANLTDGALHLVRVVADLDKARTSRADTERSVRATADRLAADTGRSVTAEVAEGPDIPHTLLHSASERHAGVVVMATRAAGALGRTLRGSVADVVVRESSRPVVLVPPGADDTRGKHIELGRVLVPLDGSALSLKAVDHLLSLPHASELEYVLLEVIPPGIVGAAPAADMPAWATVMATAEANLGVADTGRLRADAQKRLNAVAERLRARRAQAVEVRVVESADPAAAIADAVRTELTDFVAMSTHGLSGFKRMMLGSVAEKVVRESDVPVLLVRAEEAASAKL